MKFSHRSHPQPLILRSGSLANALMSFPRIWETPRNVSLKYRHIDSLSDRPELIATYLDRKRERDDAFRGRAPGRPRFAGDSRSGVAKSKLWNCCENTEPQDVTQTHLLYPENKVWFTKSLYKLKTTDSSTRHFLNCKSMIRAHYITSWESWAFTRSGIISTDSQSFLYLLRRIKTFDRLRDVFPNVVFKRS